MYRNNSSLKEYLKNVTEFLLVRQTKTMSIGNEIRNVIKYVSELNVISKYGSILDFISISGGLKKYPLCTMQFL